MALPSLSILKDALSITGNMLEREIEHYSKLQADKNKSAKLETAMAVKEQQDKFRKDLSKRYAKYLDKANYTAAQDTAWASVQADLGADQE